MERSHEPNASGSGAFSSVPPSTYYLMVYAYNYNHHQIYWNLKVDLHPGANTVTLDQGNATQLN